MVGTRSEHNNTSKLNNYGQIQDVKGTPAFMAPELLLGTTTMNEVKPFACDMYSIGACLFMMVEGRPPYYERNEIEMVERLRRGVPPSFSNKIMTDPTLKHLILELLHKDATKRIKLRDVVTHQWTTVEDSEPVYETQKEMEEALQDQSQSCRESISQDDINKAFSISLVAFHVVVRSRAWLMSARKKIQENKRNADGNCDGGSNIMSNRISNLTPPKEIEIEKNDEKKLQNE